MAALPFSFFVVGKHRLDDGACHVSHLTIEVAETDDGCFVYEIEDADGERALFVANRAYSEGARAMHRMVFHGVKAMDFLPGDPASLQGY